MSDIHEDRERLLDLVRYQRSELHRAELITDTEYEQLLAVKGSRDRLESYDELRDDIRARDERIRLLEEALERACGMIVVHEWKCNSWDGFPCDCVIAKSKALLAIKETKI